MTFVNPLVSGALIGLSIAAPIGPMAILCIHRTLDGGMRAGLSTGAGASTVNLAYGSLVLAGLKQAGPWLDGSRDALTLLAGMLMVLFAWRILRPRGAGPSAAGLRGRTLVRYYVSALLFNCANPLQFVLLLGAVGAVLGQNPPEEEVGAVLLGLFLGSLAWWTGLSSMTAIMRERLSLGLLRAINRVSAAAMIAFAALAFARALGPV